MRYGQALIIMMLAMAVVVLLSGALVLDGFTATGGENAMATGGKDPRYERITFGLG
jgi:hypothetical protein